jgi:hypothetical protein
MSSDAGRPDRFTEPHNGTNLREEAMDRHSIDERTRTELEAAAFRTLVDHLRSRTDVQNIDLMNLAGFCRNCLSKWYRSAAEEHGVDLDYDTAREIVYGMPYADWKAKYQTEATPDQIQAFADHVAKEHG